MQRRAQERKWALLCHCKYCSGKRPEMGWSQRREDEGCKIRRYEGEEHGVSDVHRE